MTPLAWDVKAAYSGTSKAPKLNISGSCFSEFAAKPFMQLELAASQPAAVGKPA
jgi:hypothetical protein